MDMHSMFNAVVGASLLMAGWILRTVWDAVNQMKNDLAELERNLPDTYVRRDDYKDDILEIKQILKDIFNKLEKKADK